MTNEEYQQRIAAANGDYSKMLEAVGEYVTTLLMAHETRCLLRHQEVLKAIGAQGKRIEHLEREAGK